MISKNFVFKKLLTVHSNVLPLHHKQSFLPIAWIFTKGEGDRIKYRLPFKIFSTLQIFSLKGLFIVNELEEVCETFYFIKFKELQFTWSGNRAVQIWFDNKNSRRVRGLDKDPYISILIQKSPFIYSRCFLLDWIQKFLLPYHCWQNWRNFP